MTARRAYEALSGPLRCLGRLLLPAIAVCAACTTPQVLVPHRIDLREATVPISEDDRLDVGIVVFDPGVPKGAIPKPVIEELIADGVYPHIRRIE
jgi:hypothetical protein